MAWAYMAADRLCVSQKGFYITLSAIPVSLAIYKFTRQGTDEQPYFTRLIQDTYNSYKVKWAERNDFHTQAVEQAAADRTLFMNETNQSMRHINLRFPEYVSLQTGPSFPSFVQNC